MTKKFTSLGREPSVLANQLREWTVSANLGQLVNQRGKGLASGEKPIH